MKALPAPSPIGWERAGVRVLVHGEMIDDSQGLRTGMSALRLELVQGEGSGFTGGAVALPPGYSPNSLRHKPEPAFDSLQSRCARLSACQGFAPLYHPAAMTASGDRGFELIQVPYSPYCIVQRRILEYSGAKFKITNVSYGNRDLIWKLTKERYYQVPILKHGKSVLFETGDNSQVMAKYLNEKLGLDLFPKQFEGVQDILWQYFENEVEGIGFKLNDIYYREKIKRADHLVFVRHKERKFGRGCLQQWKDGQADLWKQFEQKLLPGEEMLLTRPFLLDEKPRFVDFDLYGMIGNALYSGHYSFPARYTRLQDWYKRMTSIKLSEYSREKST